MGVQIAIDPGRLDQAGWGVILGRDASPAVEQALAPLLDRRRAQAGRYFRVFSGPAGYSPNESKIDFLARHGMGPGPADPDRVPYYLLIVGDPEAIPYRFQYQLDIQYAVGRIAFDTPDEYANYARNVVEAEINPPGPARKAVFFGPSHPGDQPTALTAQHLLTPLADRMRARSEWHTETLLGPQATKERLAGVLRDFQPPSLLLTACHGMGFPTDSPRFLRHQGALLCADWPGPDEWRGPVPPDFYYSADDLAPNSRLSGLIAILLASYSAGVDPGQEMPRAGGESTATSRAVVASLAKRLLGRPGNGALAVVGPVNRIWFPGNARSVIRVEVLDALLQSLTQGRPIGYAMERIAERFAETSTLLSDELEEIKYGKMIDNEHLSELWTETQDTRAWVVLGDPAARLAPAPVMSF